MNVVLMYQVVIRIKSSITAYVILYMYTAINSVINLLED